MGKTKHSFVWTYFDEVVVNAEKQTIGRRCRLCKVYTYIPKEGNASTSALINHLANRHDIKDPAKIKIKEEKTKTLVQLEIFPFTGPEELRSIGEWITIQAVGDGVSFRTIATSPFQHHAFKSMGMRPLTSPQAVRDLMMKHIGKLKDTVKLQLADLTKTGKRFSVIMDEWSNFHAKRYMSVMLNCSNKVFSLGLARCRGSMTAAAQLEIVTSQLEKFGMDVKGLVGLGSDGASVMKAVGNLMTDQIHQICHGK